MQQTNNCLLACFGIHFPSVTWSLERVCVLSFFFVATPCLPVCVGRAGNVRISSFIMAILLRAETSAPITDTTHSTQYTVTTRFSFAAARLKTIQTRCSKIQPTPSYVQTSLHVLTPYNGCYSNSGADPCCMYASPTRCCEIGSSTCSSFSAPDCCCAW
jgi:hypothetical protein